MKKNGLFGLAIVAAAVVMSALALTGMVSGPVVNACVVVGMIAAAAGLAAEVVTRVRETVNAAGGSVRARVTMKRFLAVIFGVAVAFTACDQSADEEEETVEEEATITVTPYQPSYGDFIAWREADSSLSLPDVYQVFYVSGNESGDYYLCQYKWNADLTTCPFHKLESIVGYDKYLTTITWEGKSVTVEYTNGMFRTASKVTPSQWKAMLKD